MNDAVKADNITQLIEPMDQTHGDIQQEGTRMTGDRDDGTIQLRDIGVIHEVQDQSHAHPVGYDGSTLQELLKKYWSHLSTVHRTTLTVPHRRWSDSIIYQAAGAALTDKARKYWVGPTIGLTAMDRIRHRRQKATFSNRVFTYTLAQAAGQGLIGKQLSGPKRVPRGGGGPEPVSLFTQYTARLEQLPTKEVPGHTRYTPKHRSEFDKMSRKRQLLELRKIGLVSDSADEAVKIFIHADPMYPDSHTSYDTPILNPATLKTAEILHHQHHLHNKIGRLRKLRRESKREAMIALRRRRRDRHQSQSGQEISIGTQRAKNIYLINRSIVEHVKVVQQLEVQLRRRIQLQNKELKERYVGDDIVQADERGSTDPPPAHQRRRGCRHHTRFQKPASVAEPNDESDKPTFLQELRRSRIRKWEKRSNKVHYRTAQDRVGGFLTARCEELRLDAGTITVCTMNVRGFDDNDNKLEMILQFCQDESIDVMVCIDAQLDEKRGHWYGKICKRRLGVGTRTNVNPCMINTGGQRPGPRHRVGGIFTIIGPKWGTSLVNFQKDKFGVDGGPAGVMSQVTLATSDSPLTIIGTYWPNKNEMTDRTLWNTLNRYVHQHRLRDSTPIDLLQRVSQQWIATAFKNGARGSILCGDLNATWTGVEPGGQSILQHWADSFSLTSGVRQVARHLNCDMYTRGGDGQPQTWIDHLLHKGLSDNIACMAGYTSQAPEWVGLSDHKPIWGVYKVHPPLQKCPKARRAQKVRYELHLTDKQKCDEFIESMETLLELSAPTDDSTDEEVMEYMRRLEQHSAHTVKRLYQAHGQARQRSSRKNGWSPMYIAYKAQLTSLVEIRRHVMGHAHRPKWNTTALMLQDLPEILGFWESTVDGLGLTPAQHSQLADGDHPLRWWKTVVDVPDIGLIDNEIDRIKKSLHGTARTEMRRRISVSIRSREDARRDGKWKKVIGSLLGHVAGRRHQAGIDLEMITTDDGKILGDPEDIHQAVTNRFEDWFDIPDECQGDLHEGHNWRQCRDSEAYFVRDTAHTGAPEDIRRLIHRAIANVPRQQLLQEELRDNLRDPPTLADFEAAIQHSKTNSSAGISGCSYNQLKKWPPELIKRVHYCLCRVWRSHLTPDWWSSRWLVVIPKKQEEIPNVSNMRPLILVEAVRKIWCKLLLHRILEVWGKHNVLHRFQHGFIHGRSTMTASTLFINMLEDAIEKGHPLHTCTWDITKAFDSVTKNVMKLAWTRLGVPDEWVQWLVGMDEKGTTTVRTPHAIAQWNKDGPSCLSQRSRKKRDTTGYPEYQCPGYVPNQPDTSFSQDTPGLGFRAIRGTGQGDVTSPTCWAAIFDILLTALHLDIQETRAAQHVAADSNRGYEEGETAYADDLLSCARTPEALQRKADIVSTFCLIMGLQLSTTKLRRFVMAHSGLDEGDDTTIVHLYGTRAHVDGPTWDAIEIQAATQGTLDYLGGKYDTDGSARTIIEDIKEVARTHCAEIGNTAASALTKLKCSSMTTYAKIRYSGKLASTTLAELTEVDKIFYKFHAKTTKNMMSFPYDLMYQRPEYGGVGLQRYSDLNSIDKLSEMFRAQRRTDEVHMAMGGLLQRMARVHGHEVGYGYKYRFAHKRGHRTWLRSACEWLDKHNLHLWRGGSVTSVHTLSSAINLAIPGLSTAQKRQLKSNGIVHMGDIIDDRAGTRVWSIPDRCQWLLPQLPDEPTTDSGVVLWPGQFWQPYVDTEGVRPSSIIEIMQVIGDQQVVVGIWRQSDRKGTRTRYTKDKNQVTVSIAGMFRDKHTERWDAIGRRGTTCSFARSRLVPSPKATIITDCPSPRWVQQAAQFCATQGPTYKPRIYTDGSYAERDHDLHSVFDTDAVTRTAAAGIAIVHDGPDWTQRPMYAIHVDHGADIGARSAYTMEYLALAMAMRIQGPEIRATAVGTDSMAVLKRIHNRHYRLGQADESHRLLLQSIDKSLAQGAVMPTWIPSHPERRKPDVTAWTMDDWGNHLADKIASKSRNVLRTIHPDIKWATVQASEVIGSLPRQGEYYFGDVRGRPSALHGLLDHVHQVRRDRYTAARDLQRYGGPKWMDNTIQFAAKVYNGQRGSPGQYAHTARMIWDKHWHGRNRIKQCGLLPDGQRVEELCHMCDNPDSQHHCFRWCNHSNVRAIREETSLALQNYDKVHSSRTSEETLEDHQLKMGLISGVLHEFHNCADAGRVWTGNWNSSMITRVQTSIMADHLTKKQCRALRITLHDLYDIIAQGANDIMDVRHGVRTTLDAQHQELGVPVRPGGQRSIVDYLYNSRGLTGADMRAHNETISDARDHEEDTSIHSDNSLENNASWQDECTTGHHDVWLRDITAEDRSSICNDLTRVAHSTQRITTVGKHGISAGSLQRLTQGLSVDSSVVDGYLHMLQARHSGVKCMGSSFFSKLYNPAGYIRHMPRDTFNMGYASQHFNNVDITRYQLILIPILVKKHWTLIVVDMNARHIRYLNSGAEGGSDYLLVIKRWLALRWKANSASDFQMDDWRCLSSHASITPQQADDVNCGIFTLMFAECIVMGKDITSFSSPRCQTARWHIAKSLLDHETSSVPTLADNASTHAATPPLREARSYRNRRGNNKKTIRPSPTERARIGYPTPAGHMCSPPVLPTTTRDRLEINADIESLDIGGWLTDTVINDYFQLLQLRSAAAGNNHAFLSAHFYNRLYDPTSKAIRPQYYATDNERNAVGLTELDMIREMHQHNQIFNYSRVYIPLAQPQHWGLLEVDNTARRITYMDSLYNGGGHYAQILGDYLTRYEIEITGQEGPPWAIRTTIHPDSVTSCDSQVRVPRQTNGNDCGVFVCLLADLLDRQQDLMHYRTPDTNAVRTRIRGSLQDKVAFSLTTGPQECDGSPYMAVSEPFSSDNIPDPQSSLRRSARSNRFMGSMAETDTALDLNHHRLAVRQVPDMGWCLFALQPFSHSERAICTYHGRHITARQAKSKSNKSRYIVELKGANNQYSYIDGYDATTQLCYSAGPYANDGINWLQRRDLWNAELAPDDYNPDIFVLRPLRDITAGEQIYVWYGPRYWCSDDHSVEHMAMAVMTYGIDIDTSTEAAGSYGNWLRLSKIQALRQILAERRYTPPPTMADITNITVVPGLRVGCILESTEDEIDLNSLPNPTSTPTLIQRPPLRTQRSRAGTTPIARRKQLVQVVQQHAQVKTSIIVTDKYSRVDRQEPALTAASANTSFASQMNDSNVTAPDAIDEQQQPRPRLDQGTQDHANLNDASIRRSKRTFTQALLPDSYRPTRTTRHRWSS